jgi:hypothetical protein
MPMLNYLKNYINYNIRHAKLEVVDSISHMISAGIYGILVGLCGLMILLIGTMAAGFLFSTWLDDMGTGFLIIAVAYFIYLIMAIVFRKKIIRLLTNNSVEAAMHAMDESENDTP